MALDPVPTWIHGAKHSGDILRQNTFNASNGAEGVTSPTAFRVRETETPSNEVRVDPGGLLMLSPWDEGQTYSMRNASETLVEVPASSSLSANTWYINAWINDPNKPGGTTPESTQFGPYNFLTCDPAPKNNNPAYACAKIVVPKDTATITQDMITDLREVANPVVGTKTFSRPRLASDDDPRQNYLAAFWDHGADGQWFGELFPGGWGSPNIAEIKIPRRASHMAIRATWATVYQDSGLNGFGRYWVEYGDEWKGSGWGDGRNLEFATQTQGFNTTGTAGVYSKNWILIDTKPIPAKLRGKTIQFAFKAGRSIGSANNAVFMNSQSSMGLDLVFSMAPDNEDTV